MSRCDKCGQEIVPEYNDLAVVAGIANAINDHLPEGTELELALNLFRMTQPPRHFLPVYNKEGERICEGSPSRAQYIEGQPRDTRGYPYVAEEESIFRAAYAKAQEKYP